MPKQLKGKELGGKMSRYYNPKIVEHIASQYVLGTLTPKVQQRVIKLMKTNDLLEQRINNWEQRLVVLDEQTPELPASEQSWKNITTALNMDALHTNSVGSESANTNTESQRYKLSWFKNILFGKPRDYLIAFSFTIAVLFSFNLLNTSVNALDQLSYVAVLTEDDGQAHLVATTYGESKKLIVNVVNTPTIESGQALELWVVSKTDQQARSFGVIPIGETLIEQQLTQAQWRLIKDSHSLIVTIEDEGGSPIGEPSDLIVSKGLCVRLQEWKNNA